MDLNAEALTHRDEKHRRKDITQKGPRHAVGSNPMQLPDLSQVEHLLNEKRSGRHTSQCLKHGATVTCDIKIDVTR